MNYYTLQYLSIILLLDKLLMMNLEQAEKFKNLYLGFIQLTSELLTFIKNHQFIQGFQIQTSEFYKSDSKTISSIEEYIVILRQNPKEKEEENFETLELSPDEIRDLEEFESQALKEKSSNTFSNEKSSGLTFERNESNQKAKEEVARLVGSNISPLKKKSGKQSSQIKERKWDKKPLLILGLVKTEEKALEENLKSKYKVEVLSVTEENKGTNYGDLVDLPVKKFESEEMGIIGGKRKSRKDSMSTNQRPSKIIKVDFEPDFDKKIYDTFLNGFSHLFNLKDLGIRSGAKDDSMLKKMFF